MAWLGRQFKMLADSELVSVLIPCCTDCDVELMKLFALSNADWPPLTTTPTALCVTFRAASMVFVMALMAPVIALMIGRWGLGRVGRGRRVVVVVGASVVAAVVVGASVAGAPVDAMFGCVGGTVSNASVASDGNDSALDDIGVGAGSGSLDCGNGDARTANATANNKNEITVEFMLIDRYRLQRIQSLSNFPSATDCALSNNAHSNDQTHFQRVRFYIDLDWAAIASIFYQHNKECDTHCETSEREVTVITAFKWLGDNDRRSVVCAPARKRGVIGEGTDSPAFSHLGERNCGISVSHASESVFSAQKSRKFLFAVASCLFRME